MKMMGLMSKGFVTAQKVRWGGGKSLSAWRGKRFGLRWVRTVLRGSKGRWRMLLLCLIGFVLSLLLCQAKAPTKQPIRGKLILYCSPILSLPKSAHPEARKSMNALVKNFTKPFRCP